MKYGIPTAQAQFLPKDMSDSNGLKRMEKKRVIVLSIY